MLWLACFTGGKASCKLDVKKCRDCAEVLGGAAATPLDVSKSPSDTTTQQGVTTLLCPEPKHQGIGVSERSSGRIGDSANSRLSGKGQCKGSADEARDSAMGDPPCWLGRKETLAMGFEQVDQDEAQCFHYPSMTPLRQSLDQQCSLHSIVAESQLFNNIHDLKVKTA